MSCKIINWIVYVIVFSLPLYLVNFKIGWVPFNILELLICGLFIFWLFFGIKDRLFFNNRIWIPVLMIFFGVTISTWFSNDIEISAGIWKGWFVIPLLFFIVLLNSIKTKEHVKNIIISLTFSGLFVSLIALYYWFNGVLTYDGRLQGFYLSPNYLAMYLSPILILSLYLFSFVKNKILKTLLIINYLLLISIIYLTYSYGAWVGFLFALIFLLIQKKDKKMILIFLSLFILILILQIPTQKFQGFIDFSYPSLESRIIIWQSSWEIIKDNALIGIGPGMFQKYYLDYQVNFAPYPEWSVPQPHNIFLAFWLQAGLLGLVGFFWLLISFFKKIEPKQILSSILIGTMIYILIHGMVDTTYWKNDLSIIFWLIISIASNSYSIEKEK